MSQFRYHRGLFWAQLPGTFFIADLEAETERLQITLAENTKLRGLANTWEDRKRNLKDPTILENWSRKQQN